MAVGYSASWLTSILYRKDAIEHTRDNLDLFSREGKKNAREFSFINMLFDRGATVFSSLHEL